MPNPPQRTATARASWARTNAAFRRVEGRRTVYRREI
jgi:hypothetical protein